MNQSSHSMRDEIKHRMKKTDLYQTLDLRKDCTAQDIKKSYKRLALRFHPDKNKIQGSKDVFNKITHAYSLLTDTNKKSDYDKKTTQTKQNKNANYYQFNGFNKKKNFDGFNDNYYNFSKFYQADREWQEKQKHQQADRRRKKYQKQMNDMQKQFTNLFNKFFAAATKKQKATPQTPKQKQQQYQKNEQKQYMERMKKKYRQQRWAQQKKERVEKEQKKKTNQIIIFLVIFAAIVFGPSIMNFTRSKPLYSFSKTNIHKFEMKTPQLKLPYYVSDEYFTHGISQTKKIWISEQIDKKYVSSLRKQCFSARNTKKSYEEKAFREKIGKRRQGFLQKARNVNDHSCDLIVQLVKQHPEYIKTLAV